MITYLFHFQRKGLKCSFQFQKMLNYDKTKRKILLVLYFWDFPDFISRQTKKQTSRKIAKQKKNEKHNVSLICVSFNRGTTEMTNEIGSAMSI